MAAIIGALRGVLSLDSAAFETGANRSQATMGNVERRMVRMAGKVEGAGRRMSLGFTAPLVGMAAVALKTSLSVVDSQAKMAQSLGTSVKSLQVLDRAADLSGVSMGEMEQATIQLTKRLSQVESGGAKGAAKALDRLHLSANDLQSLPLDERIGAIQTAMARYVPEAERAAIASELFGSRAGLIFTRIDSSALRVATQDVNRFGLAVSEVDADKIELANDAISRLGLVGRGVANQITVSLAPAIEGISDKIALAGEWFAGLNGEAKQTIAVSASLAAGLGPVALGLGAVLRIGAPLVGVLAAVATPVGAVVAGLSLAAGAGVYFSDAMKGSVSFAEAHELAMDNVTFAMGDQFKASVRLSDALKEGGPITLAVIEAKMAEAEARRAVTAELVKERQEKELEALGYYQVLEAMGEYRGQLNALRTPGDDLEQMPARLRSSYEESERALAALIVEQQRLLAGVRSQNHLTKEEQANLDLIARNIAELQRRWNELNGITSQNVELTDRGSVSAGNLAGNLGLAAGQAATLRSFLAGLPGALAGSAANIAGLRAGIASLSAGGSQAAANVAKYRAQLEASLLSSKAMHYEQRQVVQEGIDEKVRQYELEQRLTKEFQTRTTAVTKLSAASGGAAKKVENQLTKEIAQRRALLAMTGKDRQMFEAVLSVQQRLGSDAAKYSQAQIKALAGQVVALDDTEAAMQRVADQQGRWSDNITRLAFDGGSLGDTIQGMLRDVAYQFSNSKIFLPVVASVTNILGLGQLAGGAGASVAGGAAGGSSNGLLGGLLGSKASGLLGGGGFLGGIGAGAQAALGAGGFASAGLFNVGANAATAVAGGAGAFSASLGAALPVAGIALLVAAGLKKAFSREYFGTALRGSLNSEGFAGTSFDFHKGGAFRSDKEVHKAVPKAIQSVLDTTMTGVTTGLSAMAVTLGLSSAALADFNDTGFTLWTNGKSQAQIQEELGSHIESASVKMADLVLGTDEFTRSGETAQDTLTRLSSGLSATNDMADLLGHRLFKVSLTGADAASHLVDLFGGVETMTSATSAYMQAVYSDSERSAITVRRLRATFDDLNLAMPESRVQLRGLVEGLDTTTESGRKTYAEVIKLSGALDGVLPKVGQFSLSVSGMVDQITGQVGSQIDFARGMASDAKAASTLWYRTATTLRSFLSDLLNTNLSAASTAQAKDVNRRRFDLAFGKARDGDVDAAREIPALAKAYLSSAQTGAASALEYRRVAAGVQGQVNFLAGLSELEGANKDVLQTLYGQQIEVLTNLGNFLKLDGLTKDQIAQLDTSIQGLATDFDGTVTGFETALGGLETAIKAAEMFSYDYLKERLNVAVDILPTANIPDHLKALIANAKTGITSAIDFVVRSDLSAPNKWMALQSTSEHIKTIRFAADHSQWSASAQNVALGTAGRYLQTVQLLAQNKLGNLSDLALKDAGEFVQSIEFVAGAVPQPARDILLGELDAIQREISFKMGDTIPDAMQRLALDKAASFQRVINVVAGSVPANVVQRLALDRPVAFRRSLNILAGRLPSGEVRSLALADAAAFTRTLNIETGKQPAQDVIRLALARGSDLRRTVHMLTGRKLDGESARLALAGNSELSRVVNAVLSSGVDPQAMRLALSNVGAYDVAVRAALDASITGDVRKIVFGDVGTYVATVQAALSSDLPQGVRRALLQQQGDLSVNVTGVLAAGTSPELQKLLLQANTSGLRGITIAAVYADALSPADLALLRSSSTDTLRTIKAIVNPYGIDATGLLFLDQLTRSAPVKRAIDGTMWTRGIGWTDQHVLVQLGLGNGVVHRALQGRMDLNALGWTDQALLAQLHAGKGTVSRNLKSATYGDTRNWTGLKTLDQLSRGNGEVSRNLRSRLFGDTGNWTGLTTLRQLSRGDGQVSRDIRSRLNGDTRNWTGLKTLDQLSRGNGEVSRNLRSRLFGDTSNWTGLTTLRQLSRGDGQVSRDIRSRLNGDTRNWTGLKTLDQLSRGNGEVSRNLRSSLFGDTGNWTGLATLRQLSRGNGQVSRDIQSRLFGDTRNLTGSAFLGQLNQGSGSIDRIIRGAVDLGTLTPQQKTLLASINGASAGRVTLGGSFSFDPSAGFSTWFGTTLNEGIRAPMSNLTGALQDLRNAIARQEVTAGLNAYAGKMLQTDSGQYVASPDQIRELAALAGVNTRGTDAQLAYRVKTLSAGDLLDDIYVDRSGYQTRQLLKARVGSEALKVNASAYLEKYGDVAAAGQAAQSHFDRFGRAEILAGRRNFDPSVFNWKSIGLNVPGFAAGGEHVGGWRVVGERGWELEHTSASRVVSNSDARSMLDQRPVVQALEQIEHRLAKIEDQDRQLQMAQLAEVKDAARVLKEFRKVPGSLQVSTT